MLRCACYLGMVTRRPNDTVVRWPLAGTWWTRIQACPSQGCCPAACVKSLIVDRCVELGPRSGTRHSTTGRTLPFFMPGRCSSWCSSVGSAADFPRMTMIIHLTLPVSALIIMAVRKMFRRHLVPHQMWTSVTSGDLTLT